MFLSDVSYLQGTRSGMRRFIVGLASFLAAASSTGVASAAPTLTVLHSFTGYPDGIEPLGRLAMDSSGALYGTTFGGGTTGGGFGTVFKLAPPAAGKTQWTKTILYAFTGKSDGSNPRGSVILDNSGALYGTTTYGGAGAGTVFKLIPPPAGKTQWTSTVLHSFGGGNDGQNPWAGLIMDNTGALYGTTNGGGSNPAIYGTVFKLTPRSAGHTQWTETVLHSFGATGDGSHPVAGMLMDGVVTLSKAEHENPAPHIFSSGRDCRAPHVYRRRAKIAVGSC